MNAWQSIFFQSPVNSGYYDEDELPQLNWQWPNGTWFQARLHHIRDQEPHKHLKCRAKLSRKSSAASEFARAA